MATRGFALALFAAMLMCGCDVSQQRPETALRGSTQWPTLGTTGHGMAAGGEAAGTVQVPEEDRHAPAEAGQGERSIRLFGPGVSRQRQIRV